MTESEKGPEEKTEPERCQGKRTASNNPQRTERAEIFTHGVRAALMINGGAAVAILGFLGVIWDKSPGLVKWAACALLSFALGVLFAATVNFSRYQASLRAQHPQEGNTLDYTVCHRWEWRGVVASLVLFLVGVAVLVRGVRPPSP